MAVCKITLYGFAKYMNDISDDLFYNLTLPTSPYINKDVLIKNILLNGGEFEVLYSDPFFMKEAIGVWSTKWNRTITKWCEALELEYNPIENYDRKEEWTDNNTSVSTDQSSGESSSTSENTVSAYNSSTYENDNMNETGTTSSSTGSSTNDNASVHSGRMHGNIGVTTSQQMLEAELQLDAWNLYEKITDLFLTEFAIPVY